MGGPLTPSILSIQHMPSSVLNTLHTSVESWQIPSEEAVWRYSTSAVVETRLREVK